MIPKVIHYCWFGHNPKPEIVKKCIDSWKQYCPDYEIIEWNEENFDVNMIAYTRDAYADKGWAFVSDYARLCIVYNWGVFIWIRMCCCAGAWMNCWGMTVFWRLMMCGMWQLG